MKIPKYFYVETDKKGLTVKIEDTNDIEVIEVRHGRWEVGGMFDDIGRCSICHYMFPIDTAMTEFHYCPNCGAKMDRGINE
jgi:PHP family Zn ribbon phosphoesterase